MVIRQLPWSDANLLEQNRQRLLEELHGRLITYEARYELSSGRLEEELEAGHLRETAEICDWIISYHTYRALENAR